MKHEYVCTCGKHIERDYPIGKAKERVKCKCGKMAKKVFGVPMMKRVMTKV